MEDNVWVFVCTHGRFGEELMKSAEMIAGEAENVFAVSLMPGMQPEDYRAMLESSWRSWVMVRFCAWWICLAEHRVRHVRFCRKHMTCR